MGNLYTSGDKARELRENATESQITADDAREKAEEIEVLLGDSWFLVSSLN